MAISFLFIKIVRSLSYFSNYRFAGGVVINRIANKNGNRQVFAVG
jgi:hypothetical protein